MKSHRSVCSALVMATTCFGLTLPFIAHAQDQTRDQTRDQTQEQTRERIYGSQMMSRQEQDDYRARMRNMKTEQAREAFRLEHHSQMQARARERGVSLADEPPAQPGRAMGSSPGGGFGPGGSGSGGRGGGR